MTLFIYQFTDINKYYTILSICKNYSHPEENKLPWQFLYVSTTNHNTLHIIIYMYMQDNTHVHHSYTFLQVSC